MMTMIMTYSRPKSRPGMREETRTCVMRDAPCGSMVTGHFGPKTVRNRDASAPFGWVRLRTPKCRDISALRPEVSKRHSRTVQPHGPIELMSRHYGDRNVSMLQCPDAEVSGHRASAEVSRVRAVLGPMCVAPPFTGISSTAAAAYIARSDTDCIRCSCQQDTRR